MSAPKNQFVEKYGPWAVVTGASDGIGRAFARELASRGLNLVLVARREELLHLLAEELAMDFKINIRIQPTDLSIKSSAFDCLNSTDDLEIGLLVAAAGFGSSGPAFRANDQTEADLVEVNCGAVLQQCIHFGRRMVTRRRGGIVLLSSLVAFQGTPYAANYAASKAYIQALAEGLGRELENDGVDVLAVAPGPVSSGFARRADMQLGQTTPAEVVARVSIASLGRQRTVRPGWLSKLLGWGLSTTPRPIRVQIIGRIMRGMTQHQRSARPDADVRTAKQDAKEIFRQH
jgi:short-subunit dehydrogenase